MLDVETIQTADRGWTLRWLWRYQSTVESQEATPRGSNPTVEVPFPASAAEELGPNAVLRMTATPWNDWNVG